jgi:ubiquitin
MLDKVLEYFKQNEVKCKKVEDNRPEYGDFIAVFGYGKLTRKDIVKTIKENDLSCMFFEGTIRQDEYNKKGVCII